MCYTWCVGLRDQIHELVDQLDDDELSEVRRVLAARTKPQAEVANDVSQRSFLDVASDLIGSVDGLPPDLSTNPAYMDGFGE